MPIRSPCDQITKEYVTELPIWSLKRQIDQIFDDLLDPLEDCGTTPGGTFAFRPSAEIDNTDRFTIIRIELPGVEPGDVTIGVTGSVLEISGHKASERRGGPGDEFRSERSFGAFARSFVMPFAIDSDRVEARLDKGVLEVTFPKPERASQPPRRVPIRG